MTSQYFINLLLDCGLRLKSTRFEHTLDKVVYTGMNVNDRTEGGGAREEPVRFTRDGRSPFDLRGRLSLIMIMSDSLRTFVNGSS